MKEIDDLFSIESFSPMEMLSHICEILLSYTNYYEDIVLRYTNKRCRINISIDMNSVGFSSHVRHVEVDSYEISISAGLILRVALNSLIIVSNYVKYRDKDMRTCSFMCCDIFNPPGLGPNLADLGIIDETRFEEEYRLLFLDIYDEKEFWEKLTRFWTNRFSIEYFKANITPIVWSVETVVFHEIGHIVLGHLETNNKEYVDLSEFDQDALAEGMADYISGELFVHHCTPITRYLSNGEYSDELEGQIFNILYLTGSVYVLFGLDRKSLRYRNLHGYPHPDFRRLMFVLGMANIFVINARNSSIIFLKFEESIQSMREAYDRVNLYGVGRTIFQPFYSEDYDMEKTFANTEFKKYMSRCFDFANKRNK